MTGSLLHGGHIFRGRTSTNFSKKKPAKDRPAQELACRLFFFRYLSYKPPVWVCGALICPVPYYRILVYTLSVGSTNSIGFFISFLGFPKESGPMKGNPEFCF